MCCLIKSLVYTIYTWKNIKKLYKNNKFEISATSWSGKFELPDVFHSVSIIQHYVQYIIKIT